jgi:hypothetical protein
MDLQPGLYREAFHTLELAQVGGDDHQPVVASLTTPKYHAFVAG